METFTFHYRPTTFSAETQKVQFQSYCFFSAVTRFYKHVSTHHPDFILTQIRDQYSHEFYDGVVQLSGCVKSGGVA